MLIAKGSISNVIKFIETNTTFKFRETLVKVNCKFLAKSKVSNICLACLKKYVKYSKRKSRKSVKFPRTISNFGEFCGHSKIRWNFYRIFEEASRAH